MEDRPDSSPEKGKGNESTPELAPLILRWDLDKTYLATEFESLRAMMRIPFEGAEDKRSLPGVRALIRALQSEARWAGRRVETYFITASPPQIRGPIEEKLRRDGIQVDDIVYKDQIRAILRGRFRSLKQHVGYKLGAMLRHRRDRAPAGARELLFGDDWEMDPLVYTLYSDLISGAVDQESVRAILRLLRVSNQRTEELLELAKEATVGESVVDGILIHRARPGFSASRLVKYGDRLTGTKNYLQTAVVLHNHGYLGERSVAAVAESLLEEDDWTPSRVQSEIEAVGQTTGAAPMAAAALTARLDDLYDAGRVSERSSPVALPPPQPLATPLSSAPVELSALAPSKPRSAPRRLVAGWIDRWALRLAERRLGWIDRATRKPSPADYRAILVDLINGTPEYELEETDEAE